ncbi:MAG: hypothetical protein LKE40_06155 [Spirochaetia bacterium]|nr:hypothetical protein [Spirochaetia bacterium]
MKAKKLFLLLATGTCLLLMSCSTSVTVSYLKGAKYDLKKYTNIAIAPTSVGSNVPVFYDRKVDIEYDDVSAYRYSGYNRMIPDEVASAFSSDIADKLIASGYFNVMKPSVTETYLFATNYGTRSFEKLASQGMDALLVSQVSFLDESERVYIGDEIWLRNPDYVSGSSGKEYISSGKRKVTIVQTATLGITYKLINVHDGSLITSDTYTDKIRHSITADPDDDGTELPSMENLYMRLERNYVKNMLSDLVPTTVYTNVTLMDNKPKNAVASSGYDLVKRGKLQDAYDVFVAAWQKDGHIPSGYNAAIVKEAMGKRKEAISLLQEIYAKSGNSQVRAAINRMKLYENINSDAEEQLSDR